MSAKDPKDTREGGREDSSNLTSGFIPSSVNAALGTLERNSSGSASMANSLLDVRQHINAIEEVLGVLNKLGLLTDEDILPLRRLQQRGFRRNRG